MDQSGGVRVSIYDQDYTLKTSAGRAYMEEVARYVDEKMHLVADKGRTVDSLRVAVLAALHIADELFRLRQGVDAKSTEFTALLDEALGGR